jgi:GGDEF domain-containing protein
MGVDRVGDAAHEARRHPGLVVQEPTLPSGDELLREGARMLARARASEQEITLVAFEFAGLGQLEQRNGRALTEAMRRSLASKLLELAGSRGLAARTGQADFALLLPLVGEGAALRLIASRMGQPAAVMACARTWFGRVKRMRTEASLLARRIENDGRSLAEWLVETRAELAEIRWWAACTTLPPLPEWEPHAREGGGARNGGWLPLR